MIQCKHIMQTSGYYSPRSVEHDEMAGLGHGGGELLLGVGEDGLVILSGHEQPAESQHQQTQESLHFTKMKVCSITDGRGEQLFEKKSRV